MVIMAQVYNVNGKVTKVQPANGKDYSLQELQAYVGGYIEMVHLSDKQLMVVNEEGKFQFEKNIKATKLAHEHHAIYSDDYIAGNVIVCLTKEVK